MHQRLTWIFALIIGTITATIVGQAQEGPATEETARLIIDYDSSNSMWGELADKSRKYEAGRGALSKFLESEFGDREIAFRAYGHRRKDDCRDSELVVPFSEPEAAKPQISKAVEDIRPTGKTPITYSLRESLIDLDGRRGDILLISDGIETCDMDPCGLMREWRDSNLNIRVHVVGVGLTEFERVAMSCIADVSGGKYFDADSEASFSEALTEVSVAIEEPLSDPEPMEVEQSYALRIIATDDQGRSYIAAGKLFLDGEEVGDVSSHQRNVLDGAGDYEIEVGPVLRDDSIYKPVRQAFTVEEPGETTVEVTVIRPAIVTAKFIEDGEDHPGSHVTAYQNGTKVFGFRAFDEALARPGDYEFRAEPNDDNKLSVSETLIEGEHTELLFEVVTTIQFYVRFKMPNGEIFRRGSELWRDGEKVYGVFSGNPTTVRPGIYELRSEDQNLPLTPV